MKLRHDHIPLSVSGHPSGWSTGSAYWHQNLLGTDGRGTRNRLSHHHRVLDGGRSLRTRPGRPRCLGGHVLTDVSPFC